MANIIDTAEDVGGGILGGIGGAIVGFAVAGPVGAIVGGAAGAIAGASVPDFTQVDAADQFSVLTEGSVLTRANIYSHRSGARHARERAELPAGTAQPAGHGRAWRRCRRARWSGPVIRRLARTSTLSLVFGLIELDEDIFPTVHDGPNWWTGNVVQPRVVQERGAAITAYQAKAIQETAVRRADPRVVSEEPVRRDPRPESARCNHDSARWFFGRRGDGYVALFCALETTWTDNGPWQDAEIRVGGDTNIFITQIGSAAEFGTFEAFMAKVARRGCMSPACTAARQLQCSYDVPFGERLELHYDDGPRYGGEPLQDEFPRHRSPFARIDWQQDRYAIRYDGALARARRRRTARGRSAARSPSSSTTPR